MFFLVLFLSRNDGKVHDIKYLKSYENTFLEGFSTDQDVYSTFKLLYGWYTHDGIRNGPHDDESVRDDGKSGNALRDFGRILKNKIAYTSDSEGECFEKDFEMSADDEKHDVKSVCTNDDRYHEIRKLKTDGITDFKMIACINDTSHGDVIKFMTAKFKQFFKKEDDYNPFLETLNQFKRLNYTNYFENSTSYPTEDGRSSSFIVYWVIRYDETTDKYSICFGITGMDIKFSDKIVGYKQHVEERVVGYEPCHCGFFYCQQCPIFGRSETSVPIFKKYVLSIDSQQLLKEYMIFQLYGALENTSYEKLVLK